MASGEKSLIELKSMFIASTASLSALGSSLLGTDMLSESFCAFRTSLKLSLSMLIGFISSSGVSSSRRV
jgi:hypothetical protein